MARLNEPGTVEVERRVGCDVICLRGEHDMATRDTVWSAIANTIQAGRGIVISLIGADFVDSGIINILFKGDRILRERGRRLVVHVQTASVVRRTLELTNVCDSLPCCGDVEAAVGLASTTGR